MLAVSLCVACSDEGTVLPMGAGDSDATASHDVVFVPQVDDDGGDAPMVESDDGGDASEGDAGDAGDAGDG